MTPEFQGSGTSPDAEAEAKRALDDSIEAQRKAGLAELGKLVAKVQREESNPWYGAEQAAASKGPPVEIPTPDNALRAIMVESERLDTALRLLLQASKDLAQVEAEFHSKHARFIEEYLQQNPKTPVTRAKLAADVEYETLRVTVTRLENLKDYAEKLVKSRQGQLVAAQSIKTGVFALPDELPRRGND